MRAWIIGVAGLIFTAGLVDPALAEPREEIQRWSRTLAPIATRERPRLLRGDLDGHVAAVRRAADVKDWASLLVAGNLLYDLAPVVALELHEAAARLGPDVGLVQLELGYDYQRLDRCDRAVPAWSAADRLGALHGPGAAVAAYCHFKTGRLDEAIALWQRVNWRSHHTGVDKAIHAVFGGPSPLRTHALLVPRARGGDAGALRELAGNALQWRVDWWNVEPQPEAIDAVIALAASLQGAADSLVRELGCARRVADAETAPAVRTALEGCRLLLDPHPYPVSSEVGKYLLDRGVDLGLLDTGALLARLGGELAARAQSPAGDRAALEVLAFLQSRARDEAGLVRTDELGWRRYRLPVFAISRVAGRLLVDEPAARAEGRALLAEALRDFPGEARLLRYEALANPPAPAQREAAIVRLILAEYHGLYLGDMRSAGALRDLVAALVKIRGPRP